MKATRGVLIRDFLIFQLKLALDGVKDAVLIPLSIGATVLDLFSGGNRHRALYSVIRLGERFDLWLNLHGALSREDEAGDGLFGASKAGSDTMLGKVEQAVRGGDEPRRRRRRRPDDPS